MRAEDRIRLQHMRDAAGDAISFAEGRSRRDLDADRQLVLALVKAIEIIGEAATQVSPDGQSLLPQLPWADMVGMRHRLVHAYYDINLDILWKTVMDDLPDLARLLREILSAGQQA